MPHRDSAGLPVGRRPTRSRSRTRKHSQRRASSPPPLPSRPAEEEFSFLHDAEGALSHVLAQALRFVDEGMVGEDKPQGGGGAPDVAPPPPPRKDSLSTTDEAAAFFRGRLSIGEPLALDISFARSLPPMPVAENGAGATAIRHRKARNREVQVFGGSLPTSAPLRIDTGVHMLSPRSDSLEDSQASSDSTSWASCRILPRHTRSRSPGESRCPHHP
ncbi:hypothetical protein BDK51DRAFT_52219 [Blyttiomyces helicus]|uniref:Uncharacterized protein n=1 Tax=Blyttiomyces helicus TaxID=388810 RepID=A0A4P9W3C4_9FUNG|nr:hypothetical protein BDK51DRAFT_52219 [Blyttiomyces helicus]|eukprot:RKO86811.1 hypothetical protein BDK51DRAFT_52219 [Blyttiomyces helicus]